MSCLSRTSCDVHDCRCQPRPIMEQLHFVFCSRSLRIFSTGVGRTVTVTIHTPPNLNMTTPHIGIITRMFFLCISVCLLLFVLGCSLSALTPEVKFASISSEATAHPFTKVCTAFPSSEVFDLGQQHPRLFCHSVSRRGRSPFVFIVDDAARGRNRKYRKHVRGVLWGPLCSIFFGL